MFDPLRYAVGLFFPSFLIAASHAVEYAAGYAFPLFIWASFFMAAAVSVFNHIE